jgi:hypothetical protein
MGGKTPEAQKNYRAALALDPGYGPADENLSRTTGLRAGGGISMGRMKESREE